MVMPPNCGYGAARVERASVGLLKYDVPLNGATW